MSYKKRTTLPLYSSLDLKNPSPANACLLKLCFVEDHGAPFEKICFDLMFLCIAYAPVDPVVFDWMNEFKEDGVSTPVQTPKVPTPTAAKQKTVGKVSEQAGANKVKLGSECGWLCWLSLLLWKQHDGADWLCRGKATCASSHHTDAWSNLLRVQSEGKEMWVVRNVARTVIVTHTLAHTCHTNTCSHPHTCKQSSILGVLNLY